MTLTCFIERDLLSQGRFIATVPSVHLKGKGYNSNLTTAAVKKVTIGGNWSYAA
jgi:hypothetical protein